MAVDYKARLNSFAQQVMAQGASDLHLVPGMPPVVRVSGVLTPLLSETALTPEDTLGIVSEMLIPEQKEVFFATKEYDFAWSFKDKKDTTVRFRGNAYVERGSVAAALRVIPQVIQTFSQLQLPPVLETFTSRKQGFFLVVGPVGQGKSTTLASMIEQINQTRTEHILTIEDPIEFLFTNKQSIIDQREVRIDTVDFQTALKSAFRQDANVLMIGEMRTPETIATAVTAAETGHLVFSTLHTNNAAQTVDRIIDSFPPEQQDQIRIQLASSLIGIFSQRLVPRTAGGLIPVCELLINNDAVSNLIREKRSHELQTVIETGSEEGMIDMNRSLANLVRSGDISVDTAYARSWNPKTLSRLL